MVWLCLLNKPVRVYLPWEVAAQNLKPAVPRRHGAHQGFFTLPKCWLHPEAPITLKDLYTFAYGGDLLFFIIILLFMIFMAIFSEKKPVSLIDYWLLEYSIHGEATGRNSATFAHWNSHARARVHTHTHTCLFFCNINCAFHWIISLWILLSLRE